VFLRLTSYHAGRLVDDGGGLLRTHGYHIAKGCQGRSIEIRIKLNGGFIQNALDFHCYYRNALLSSSG